MEKRWEEVHNFLSLRKYPPGFSKAQKLSLRRYASKFTQKGGELFFRSRRAIKSRAEARKLFEEFHSSPNGKHSGMLKTRTAMCSIVYWLGMSVDIHKWVVECDTCQKSRKQPLQCMKVSTVWELIGIELIGPLPRTIDGFQYVLTATDYFSKWVEGFSLKTKSAAEVGRHICSIIYRHGCPKRILSDEGNEFVDELNNSLCNVLGTESVIAVYHPQTNVLDKKCNNDMKQALIKLVDEKQNNWDVFLDATLFSLRSEVNTTTKYSPFYLMYGREAVLPSEVPVDLLLSRITLPDEKINDVSMKTEIVRCDLCNKPAEFEFAQYGTEQCTQSFCKNCFPK